jgi:hypothetical protein
MMKGKNAYPPFGIRNSLFNIHHFFSGFPSQPSWSVQAKAARAGNNWQGG